MKNTYVGQWHPCDFLSDKIIRSIYVFSNEATLNGLLDGPWVRFGHKNIQAWNSAPSPTSHSHEMMLPWGSLHQFPQIWGQESFGAGGHMKMLGEWHSWGGRAALPTYLSCTPLSSGCSSVSFSIAFHIKLKNRSKCFPEFCEAR